MMDEEKIEAIKKFPTPTSIKSLQSLLGICNYYRRFIDHFTELSAPLNELLRKNTQFIWGKNQEKAFKTLLNALCTAPILEFPNLELPFIITTDASNYGIGGFLSQINENIEKPIAYTSRVLRSAEKRYSTYEKEALSIKFCIQHFRKYVFGNKFLVYTDHKPLVSFRNADKNSRVQKWRMQLAEYDFEVIHKSGKLNVIADALSRNPIEKSLINVTTRAQKAKETPSSQTPVLSESEKREKIEKYSLNFRQYYGKSNPEGPPHSKKYNISGLSNYTH